MNLAGAVKEVDGLKVICSSLTTICKVFYSLNFQDLPEFFEDNMETWMTHFLTLLSFDIKELHTLVRVTIYNIRVIDYSKYLVMLNCNQSKFFSLVE